MNFHRRSQQRHDGFERRTDTCALCGESLRFLTDGQGHALESCACGERLIAVIGREAVIRYDQAERRDAKVERKVALEMRPDALPPTSRPKRMPELQLRRYED